MSGDRVTLSWARHRVWAAPLMMFVAAMTIRFVYLTQAEASPIFDQPIMDEKYHVHLAEQINSSDGLPEEPYFRAPLYPYFLAILFQITGASLYGVRLLQIFLGSLLPILVYLLGLRLFDRRIACWVGGVCTIYPTFVYYDHALLITSLMTLLTSLLALQLLRCESKPNHTASFVLFGLLLGLAGLARPNILLLGPALLVWLWMVLRPQLGTRRAFVRYLVIAAASLIVVLPVTVRNYVVEEDFVLIAWQGGFNFFIGNNHQSNGWSATVPGIDATWEGGYRDAVAFAEEAEGRTLKRSEVSDFWYAAAWREIKNHPSTFMKLLLRKLRLFLNGYEIPNMRNVYLAGKLGPIIQPFLFAKWIYFPFGLLGPLAVIGLVLSVTHWRRFLAVYLILASYSVSLMLFFVCARFRQPLIPFLILFAVYGVFRLVEFRRRRQWKSLAGVLVLLALLLVESNHDALQLDPHRVMAEDYTEIGNAHQAQNNLAAAELEYRRALEADSTYARAYNDLGVVCTRLNRVPEAVNLFTRAITIDSGKVDSYMNLAAAYFETDDKKSAVAVLERAVVRHPSNDGVHMMLGVLYAEAGRNDDAIKILKRCLQLNPANEQARLALGQVQKTDPAP